MNGSNYLQKKKHFFSCVKGNNPKNDEKSEKCSPINSDIISRTYLVTD